MTRLVLKHPEERAKQIVKNALDETEGIGQYHEKGRQIVAKTKAGFPRILWSYGESIYIDFPETAEFDDAHTPIDVTAAKEVWTNIGANPQKFKRRFIHALESQDETRADGDSDSDTSAEKIERVAPPPSSRASKEVATESELSSGKEKVILAIIIAVVLIFMFNMMIMASMPY